MPGLQGALRLPDGLPDARRHQGRHLSGAGTGPPPSAAAPSRERIDEPRDERRGALLGAAAYAIWGLFPLYFPLLRPAGPLEILAHRIVWTFALLLALGRVDRRPAPWAVLSCDRRRARRITLAALLLAANWGVYVWAVANGHVVDAALGYFVNPLITVALGVLVLRERLGRPQLAAVVLGAAAVAVLTLAYGRVPWVALTLALSFAGYGYLKKTVALPATASLAAETAVLVVPAVAVLALVATTAAGGLVFADDLGTSTLLVLAGPVTALPLVLFGAAARRVTLSTLGLLQYLTPVGQFLCGVLVFHEPLPAARLAGFALVWVALAVLAFDALRSSRALRVARSRQ